MRALSSRGLVGRQLDDPTSGQPHPRFTQPIRRLLAFGGSVVGGSGKRRKLPELTQRSGSFRSRLPTGVIGGWPMEASGWLGCVYGVGVEKCHSRKTAWLVFSPHDRRSKLDFSA